MDWSRSLLAAVIGGLPMIFGAIALSARVAAEDHRHRAPAVPGVEVGCEPLPMSFAFALAPRSRPDPGPRCGVA